VSGASERVLSLPSADRSEPRALEEKLDLVRRDAIEETAVLVAGID